MRPARSRSPGAPDIADFGENAFRSRARLRDGVLTIAQRGWLFGLVFLVIAAVPAAFAVLDPPRSIVLVRVLYAAAGAFALIALLYALYTQEVSFDFNVRRYRVHRGFAGMRRVAAGGFDDIVAVHLKEVRMTTEQANAKRTLRFWDIGIECRRDSPTFDLWRAAEPGTARHVAGTLAAALGCRVVERPA
ncbi:MAG: hypothetical protein KJ025_15225 [Burkholderiales bacterium]|nr:hypothetical protein [Burkholderiales bacterium]